MNNLLTILLVLHINQPQLIFDFHANADITGWQIVDDRVMGGVSQGKFSLSPEGHGEFSGQIKLENNGGFSSVRHSFKGIVVKPNSKIVVTLKGDGKNYQLRMKDKSSTYYSYIKPFSTSGEWQIIEIQLSDMYPSFRGRTLDLPNFNGESIEEIVFLIANYKAESFKLLIDKIELI